MASVDQSIASWWKSTYSLANGDCVEVADLGDGIAVRHSKHLDVVLCIPIARWREFLAAVKRGELDK